MPPTPDPRPLTGEPLALDLVNTTWLDDAGPHDLLDDPASAAAWLGAWDLGPADRRTVANLRAARSAIRGVLEHPGDPEARAALEAVLGRGRIRLGFDGGGPREHVEASPTWRASWEAARDLLRLLAARPERVRPCANAACVLWFDDTTRSGTRRWCSMTGGCGSRLKARRHQARRRAQDAGRPASP